MRIDHDCPICLSRTEPVRTAVLAPFVVELLGYDPVLSIAPTLDHCPACEHRFSSIRYHDKEAADLYRDYRGQKYFEVRHKHEPWYTKAINDGIGSDPVEQQSRRDALEALLRRFKVWNRIDTVLDWGGDRGQFIPHGFWHNVVFDISGVEPERHVERIGSESQLAGRTFELVMLCHVLEHVDRPLPLLKKVRDVTADEGGFVYVEVPLERPRIWCGESAKYLDWLQRHPRLFRLVDFVSTACRVKLGFVPPLGFLKVGEHINFFSVTSLCRLMLEAKLEPITIEVSEVASSSGISKVISCLARKAA